MCDDMTSRMRCDLVGTGEDENCGLCSCPLCEDPHNSKIRAAISGWRIHSVDRLTRPGQSVCYHIEAVCVWPEKLIPGSAAKEYATS